jgi:hypothetical protein
MKSTLIYGNLWKILQTTMPSYSVHVNPGQVLVMVSFFKSNIIKYW